VLEQAGQHRSRNAVTAGSRNRVHGLDLGLVVGQPMESTDAEQHIAIADAEQVEAREVR